MDVHPDEPPLPDPSGIAADLDRTMKVHELADNAPDHAVQRLACKFSYASVQAPLTYCFLLGLQASSLRAVIACWHR